METQPTTKAATPATYEQIRNAIDQALKATNRAGCVFINPPAGSLDVCLTPLCTASKAVRTASLHDQDHKRRGALVKALAGSAKAFDRMAAVCVARGDLADAAELVSVAADLREAGAAVAALNA